MIIEETDMRVEAIKYDGTNGRDIGEYFGIKHEVSDNGLLHIRPASRWRVAWAGMYVVQIGGVWTTTLDERDYAALTEGGDDTDM